MLNNVFEVALSDYDNIADLCYSWLFSRLHYFISKHIIKNHNPTRVLDIGCGTGFQSLLYASGGSSVIGIDISENMIRAAMKKRKTFSGNDKLILFPETFDFVIRYNDLINSNIRQNIISKKSSFPTFLVGDIHQLPFPNEYFSHINCCGSVLSLVERPHLALEEMTRVLESGGTLFVEVESKWNMDRFWTLLDVLLRNKLGYRTSFKEACQPFFSPRQNISINYPYGEPDKPVNIRITLFTDKFLKNIFYSKNLKVIEKRTFLSITNAIPSTILDTQTPDKFLRTLFRMLSFLEEKIPFSLPGCTSAYFLQKY